MYKTIKHNPNVHTKDDYGAEGIIHPFDQWQMTTFGNILPPFVGIHEADNEDEPVTANHYSTFNPAPDVED